MEELENKSNEVIEEKIFEDDDLIELKDEENELKKSNISNQNQKDFDKIKKYIIYFYLNLNKNSFIFPIISDNFIINKQYVYELIKNIVKIINDNNITINFNNNNYIISLKDIEDDENIDFYIKNYELRPCKKKNFEPKKDCPSFSSSSLLKNIENEKISFISKNQLNIMLRAKYEKDQELY